jgi:hypothetical protein
MMITRWWRRRRRRFWNTHNPKSKIQSLPLSAAKGPKSDDPRLEVYLAQIADLPAHDRDIIVGVLQQILDDEAAYERRIIDP